MDLVLDGSKWAKQDKIWGKVVMFGEEESQGAKWVQCGQKEFKVGLTETKLVQVELELIEGSQNTSKCVKSNMKADK